jgi:dCMP deaminase
MSEKWDKRFLELAAHVSQWSRDPSTKVGAVIARPDHTIVSLGFNGFPRGMNDDPELYNNRDEKYSRIIHGEVNCLIHAYQRVDGYSLYTYPLGCCDRCAVQLAQAGIKRFIFPKTPSDLLVRWGSITEKTKKYLDEMKLEYIEL